MLILYAIFETILLSFQSSFLLDTEQTVRLIQNFTLKKLRLSAFVCLCSVRCILLKGVMDLPYG